MRLSHEDYREGIENIKIGFAFLFSLLTVATASMIVLLKTLWVLLICIPVLFLPFFDLLRREVIYLRNQRDGLDPDAHRYRPLFSDKDYLKDYI